MVLLPSVSGWFAGLEVHVSAPHPEYDTHLEKRRSVAAAYVRQEAYKQNRVIHEKLQNTSLQPQPARHFQKLQMKHIKTVVYVNMMMC